ncbi:MAG TPA: HAD family hydrolase [Pyrinomonadaceae bacterium]|nr:HAD family hydrolase [Pyrinomonadaceae bacterium]
MELRILLWDIDGTLIRSARHGAFKDYTIPMLERVFGTAGRLDEVSVSGMTDLQIVGEALRDEGFTPAQIRERLADLSASLVSEMERVTRGEELFYLLPGVREILGAVREHPRYRSALLTGNIEPAARLKMRLVGLDDFFTLPGAYGDDSHDRRDLPRLAAARIARELQIELRPEQFIVIGDTPNDIDCARHFGARVVAVATGRSHHLEHLLEHRPDVVLPDLADTAAVLRVFDSL